MPTCESNVTNQMSLLGGSRRASEEEKERLQGVGKEGGWGKEGHGEWAEEGCAGGKGMGGRVAGLGGLEVCHGSVACSTHLVSWGAVDRVGGREGGRGGREG
jgi:hypothetical protein